MVLKFFTVLFWLCLLPIVLALMATTYGIVIIGALLYFVIAISFFVSMIGASLLGKAMFGYIGVDMLGGLFGNDTFSSILELAAVPGSWWLTNFNQAWDDLQNAEAYGT